MGTLRQDPTSEQWVIVAPERSERPFGGRATHRPPLPSSDASCPFCPGNEHTTPPEITRQGSGPWWEQRVVPNRYPALTRQGAFGPIGHPSTQELPALGGHEVVIESPAHDERMDEMSVARLEAVLRLWRDRSVDLAGEPWARAVMVFKNFGAGAGSSLDHPHSQIIAAPICPPELRSRMKVAHRYRRETGRLLYRDLVERELRAGDRIVADRGAFVAVAPHASRAPFETWILQRDPRPSFVDVGIETLGDLAVAVRDVLAALRRGAGDPDYNLVLQSAAPDERSSRSFGWHLMVIPRTTTSAGFELGTGMAINPVPPERAAALLRDALRPASVA